MPREQGKRGSMQCLMARTVHENPSICSILRNSSLSTPMITVRTKALKALIVILILVLSAACSDHSDSNNAGDTSGANSYYPEENWPNIHRDAGNTDSIPSDGATALEFAWSAKVGGITLAAPTIGPDDQLYITLAKSGCTVYAFDSHSGEEQWCLEVTDLGAAASSVLIDKDNSLYIGDTTAMRSYDASGQLRWETPIVAAPISAQFTPDGHLIFTSFSGRIYVLDRQTGEHVITPYDLVPGAGTPGSLLTCLVGDVSGSCVVPNTLAIDTNTGVFYITVNIPSEPSGIVAALRYTGGSTSTIEPVWQSSVLTGGSGASIVISADGTRLYGNDGADNTYALDAATGELLWLYPIGYTPIGSPSVTPNGRIIPAPLNGVAVAIQDQGDHAERLWTQSGTPFNGLLVQTGNDLAYTSSEKGAIILNATTGEVIGIAELDIPVTTVGTALSSDGMVFFAEATGSLYGFRKK